MPLCHSRLWQNGIEALMSALLNLDEYLGVNTGSNFELATIVESGLPTETLSLLKGRTTLS